ncbi:HTH_Tnp_Tc3_2 domain-containing protein [Trichonephila clavipes]|nr:HTH_Tnp_Tc3_2 domain-containing protein [Trichonephila clavipes]
MPTSAIKDVLKKWADVRAMVLEWHPNQADVSRLNDGASRTVSKRTVQRSLHRMGFGSHRPTRISLLNAHHRAARLAWAREHSDWSVEDWKRVA